MADSRNEELTRLLSSGVQPVKIEAPQYYASIVSVMSESNAFTLILAKGSPAIVVANNEQNQLKVNDVQAIVDMSPQTAKDLHVLLGEALGIYEKEFGEIRTDFLRGRQQR